ncbi:PHD finger protein 3 isoform X2 [Bufo gargarizans]|uniref:PHD finger protein 3 isoform X2 n=1 Tax=Bufo gargarizans TaxID=30331 RepID=UPI001CF0EF24|nr:PHD finger protein 3 isoform X2 [Bufo gargarizans]
MDIVDTFNHLIPSEHLDDALFLGDNLEGEGCDEFATNQHVLEDSLKNMLSDKDPMLGSASTQFCLPVLDNSEPSFQLPTSTGVGLEDIMDVGVDKVTVNDVEDMILSDKSVNKLDETSRKSVRKSPRLKTQEPTRSLRQSTIEKSLNTVKVSSPKKTRYSRNDKAGDKLKDEEHVLPPGTNDIRSKGTTPLEEASASPVSSRRSSRIANKEVKDKMNTPENKTPEEYSSPVNEILGDKNCILEKGGDKEEILHDDALILLNENANKVLDEMTEPDSSNSQGEQALDQTLAEPGEGKEFELYQPEEKKTDVIYDKVHQELALLSGVIECNLDVKTVAASEINDECMLQNADEGSTQGGNTEPHFIPSEVSDPSNKVPTETDISAPESSSQSHPESEEKVKVAQKEKSHNRKGGKKVKSTSAKLPVSEENSEKSVVAANDAVLNTKTPKSRTKITKNLNPQTIRQMERVKIAKVKKKISESTRIDKVPLKSKLKKTSELGDKKRNAPTLLKQLEDALRDNQGSLKEVAQAVPSRSGSRSLSHSSDKAVSKQTSLKVTTQIKDDGEKKETTEQPEEKAKLKKSLPPRQRKSSKSISVDEPPLFIPDNIPTIKKEGTDVTSPTDKYIWNPTRNCSSCRKLHGNRFMVGCGRCDDWFHGECVGLNLAQAQQMEVDDKEYICAKCCAEEETMDNTETDVSSDNQKTDFHQDLKALESEKSMTTESPTLPLDRSKPNDDAMKNKEHKVKISKKVSGDTRHSTENKDADIKRQQTFNRKGSATAVHRVSDERREKPSKDPATTSTHDEKTIKPAVTEKIDTKKRKLEKKGSSSGVTSPSTPKPSVEQIRQSVRHSLKDILIKRLSESHSKIPEERATKVSAKIEKELFSFYRDTDAKYKNKYRSLMFNLKDPKNNVLYKRVLKGDITPEHLIKMTPEELASRELAAWRQRENRHTIEMIEKEQREVERRPITKITHKGEIEIESDAPMKEPEAMDTEFQESVAKPVEKEEEVQKEKEDPVESTSDTTAQHKNHLFDLNCKICTGRMAPPAEDLSPKKAKLATNVIHKQSDTEADNGTETASSVPGSLDVDMLETEKSDSPKDTLFSAASSESFSIMDTAEDESTFLARLTYIWKGFLNMPSVAKFVIKAYPVSGSLEHLSEDLPESIQVGGRISPQTVWDYVEKIKASGTKETCVIRFTPETEEDQISYTLLYSYFSSRKRYGVVANNMRQVKDMYLIPLGASEKIPHYFVPFDGPGLEARRPNLLLALIIRQKVKRQHSTSIDDEHSGSLINVPEKKRNRIELEDDDDEEDDENDFFNSFTAVLHKNRNRAQIAENEEPQATVETVPEKVKLDPPKPLRFLPGVLVGWENPQSTLDLANNPLPVDDILQSLLGTTENVFEVKPPSIANNDKPLKEEKSQVIDESFTSEIDVEMNTTSSTVEETTENLTPITTLSESSVGLSLKDKPPDVPTEVFLSTMNVLGEETIDKSLLEEQDEVKHNVAPNSNMSSVSVAKSNVDDDSNVASVDVGSSPKKSPKLIHSKRDPRQAAGRGHHITTSDRKDLESDSHPNKGSPDSTSHHKKDRTKKHAHGETDVSSPNRPKASSYSSSTDIETDIAEELHTEKQFPSDLLIDDTDPLQQFRRALAANKSQTQPLNAPHSENAGKNPAPVFSGSFSPLRLQQPSFLPLKSSPPGFPFQHAPGFPLPGNPLFPYAPHIPPLLPTPLGIGFPRPPRFQSAESTIHNPLVAWHPALQLARQPPHFFGQVSTGPLLNTDQVRYQGPQTLYLKDLRGPERRHSDPWDKQDRISERSSSRGSRSDHRKRFYSESHHSRDKRHEKESGSDKHGDRDSERSRRKDRDKERSHDRDRKSRDESHREKERSRSSHSDKSSSKEGKSDKSKSEDRSHDKEKSRDKNRDRMEEKERDRHHKDKSRDHSEKTKSKR